MEYNRSKIVRYYLDSKKETQYIIRNLLNYYDIMLTKKSRTLENSDLCNIIYGVVLFMNNVDEVVEDDIKLMQDRFDAEQFNVAYKRRMSKQIKILNDYKDRVVYEEDTEKIITRFDLTMMLYELKNYFKSIIERKNDFQFVKGIKRRLRICIKFIKHVFAYYTL
jgi:hypothetical protein